MTDEAFEIEQDRHLKSMASRTQIAEKEAFDAIEKLNHCIKMQKVYMLLCLFSTVVAVALGLMSAYTCNVI